MPPTAQKSNSAQHPIAVVADRTGLSQDVIRVWERRYGAVEPVRGKGGQRLYTDADIRRLDLLNRASDAGRSIGQIASLPTEALARMVEEDEAARGARSSSSVGAVDAAVVIDTALTYTRSLASASLEDLLRRAASRLGTTAFVEHVAAPLLRKVGDEWHLGRLSPSQEHLTSSILQDILIGTMRGFSQTEGAPSVLVATPAGERHAIGAALVGAAAALHGWNVIYLGPDLPAADIATAAIATDVTMVAISIVYVDDRARVLGELRTLRELLPESIGLAVGGAGAVLLWRELSGSGVRVGGNLDVVFGSSSADVR